ncbi:MAG: hypothetical protein P8Y63_10150 [Deltaproteobacteria bacterium]
MIAGKALHIMGAKSVSDHWKEKVVLAYSRSLFSLTMKLAAFLAIIGATGILFVYTSSLINDTIIHFIISQGGILLSMAVAGIYLSIRKFLV